MVGVSWWPSLAFSIDIVNANSHEEFVFGDMELKKTTLGMFFKTCFFLYLAKSAKCPWNGRGGKSFYVGPFEAEGKEVWHLLTPSPKKQLTYVSSLHETHHRFNHRKRPGSRWVPW